jgi:hypothetical protein
MACMTMRERMLAVLQGREHDRVPFVQYEDLAAPDEEVWSVIGRDNMGVARWSAVHRIETPHCRIESQEIEWHGFRGVRRTLHTPEGQLTEVRLREPTTGGEAFREHFIKEPADYRVFMSYLRDVVVHPDLDRYVRDLRELGDDGLPMVAVDRTPFQHLWILWVNLTDLCNHLADHPDLVEECISLLTDIERRIFAIVLQVHAQVPIPFVNFPDNITAPIIGPRYFRKYCVPLYQELADMLADKGVPVMVHMDGDLKPLWDAIGESRIGGIDSLTPPPNNDTSAAQAHALWPWMRLWVNFPSVVHHFGPEAVYQQAWQILSEAGHTGLLQIQISENIPVGIWRTSYPAIVRAIEDFGAP